MHAKCLTLSMFIVLASTVAVVAADDLDGLEQRALNEAVNLVANAVVQIQTVGGLEQVEQKIIAGGPTTGVVVSPDGYVVSSAFNFVQQPASILVRLPDGQFAPAEIVGRDRNRMLVLLKVAVDQPLPIIESAPMSEVRPGQWAAAIGRTFDQQRVNVSVGIVSAVGRMHGRAIQTDANVSAANYGGALVDIHGRVVAILVPMAPQMPGVDPTSELAGAEYYDSGIGFGIPLEHVQSILERWIAEGDLDRGLLGIGLRKGNPHAETAQITTVWPRSPAALASWQPGDQIVAVNGTPIATQTALRFQIVPRYAGDRVRVTVQRGEEQIESDVTLAAELEKFRHAFLGVLPRRDRDADQLTVRAVWPGGPAAKAGIRAGDRIVKIEGEAVTSLSAATTKLNAVHPGAELQVAIEREGEPQEVTAQVTRMPTEVLTAGDLPAAVAAPAADAAAVGEMELQTLKLPDMPQRAVVYQPANLALRPGLLLWLSDGNAESAEEYARQWRPVCDRDGLVFVAPNPAAKSGWSPEDMEFLARLLTDAARRYQLDPARVAVVGEGKAGQLAYALAFGSRGRVRGVVGVGAPLPRTLSIPDVSPNHRLALLSVAAEKSPLSILIQRDVQRLAEKGHPATLLTRRLAADDQSLDRATREKVARWLDALDRF